MTNSRNARVIIIKQAEFQAFMAARWTWSGFMTRVATLSAMIAVNDMVEIRVRPETSVWWIQNPSQVMNTMQVLGKFTCINIQHQAETGLGFFYKNKTSFQIQVLYIVTSIVHCIISSPSTRLFKKKNKKKNHVCVSVV
jgi:hypothetical protein